MTEAPGFWLCWTKGDRRHITTDPEGNAPTLCGKPVAMVSTNGNTGKPIAFAPHWDDYKVCLHCRPRWIKATTPDLDNTIEARRQRLGLAT